jgi:hypothetical protein
LVLGKEDGMRSRISILAGAVIATVLMVMALRMWDRAAHVAFGADRPQIALYAGRAAAVATGALAQMIVILIVLGNLYRRRASDMILRVLAAVVFMVSLVSAIALSLAARG